MNKYTLIGALVLLIGAFAGGFYLGKGDKEIQIVEKEGKERIVWKDRIVTVTRVIKPDGTVIEETKTKEKEGQKDKETKGREEQSKPILADYSLGAKYWVGKGRALEKYQNNIEIIGGRRMFGDIWLEAGVLPMDLQLSVGVSLKW